MAKDLNDWLTDRLRSSFKYMPTESSLFKLLKLRYPSASYALFPQVRDSTGYVGKGRTADAIAFGLWPSRGLEVEGFEMKCSRQDWAKELKTPEKAEAVCQFCDRWYLVVSDEKIVHEGELPSTWGLLVQKGEKLVVKTPAPKLTPVAMDRGFIASIMRKMQDTSVSKDDIKKEIEAAYDQGHQIALSSQAYKLKHLQDELTAITKSLEDFESKSGIKLDTWNGGNIGEAVKLICEYGPDAVMSKTAYLRNQIKRTLEQLDEDLSGFDILLKNRSE